MPRAVIYRFGLFEFDPSTLELRRNGTRVALEPQPARALSVLLAAAGVIVTREDLKDAIWGADTHVDFDRGLAYVVSQIRTALGDSADNPRFVQTLPRRGYKFIAPLDTVPTTQAVPTPPAEPVAGSSSPANAASGSTEPARRRPLFWAAVAATIAIAATVAVVRNLSPPPTVVAVSVFDNETGLAEHDRLVAGLADLVVARLTQVGSAQPDGGTPIAVVGNAAVLRQPRNIRNLATLRQQLDADYLLLGQLQRDGSGLRFITHFIRMRDEAHLAANRLSFPEGDLSTLEARVVEEFEQALHRHVLAAR